MNKTVLVLIGSGIGGVIRFWLSLSLDNTLGKIFPYDTLAVNVLGSFFMGLVAAIAIGQSGTSATVIKYLLLIGFMGGFTTFSTFSLDTMNFLTKGATLHGLLNIICNVSFCLLAVWLGSVVGKQL